MSQQEFEPGLQSKQDSLNEDDEIQYPQYPYSWSGKPHQEGVPRDEPPSSYDTTMMQEGYQVQSSGNPNATDSSQSKAEGRYEYVAPEGDADAYEQGYRPYNTYNATRSGQSVPPWARPQRHQRNPMRLGFILLILITPPAKSYAPRIYLTHFDRHRIVKCDLHPFGGNDRFFWGYLWYNYRYTVLRDNSTTYNDPCFTRHRLADVPASPRAVLETWPLVVLGWYHMNDRS